MYLLVDEEVSNMYNFIVGANETGYHIENVNYGRDFEGTVGDYRNITEGEKVSIIVEKKLLYQEELKLVIYLNLGTKYSEAMNANFYR